MRPGAGKRLHFAVLSVAPGAQNDFILKTRRHDGRREPNEAHLPGAGAGSAAGIRVPAG